MPEYREVPGYPGYRVGDDGTVWSCWAHGRSGTMGAKWHKLRRMRWSKYGHVGTHLMLDGKKVTRSLAAIVLTAFVGPKPEGMEACHFPDRDPTNCTLANLRWGTRQENVQDCKRDGTLYGSTLIGEKNMNAKLTEADVRVIRAAKGWGCVRELAARFGVSRTTIISIRMGRTWRHVK